MTRYGEQHSCQRRVKPSLVNHLLGASVRAAGPLGSPPATAHRPVAGTAHTRGCTPCNPKIAQDDTDLPERRPRAASSAAPATGLMQVPAPAAPLSARAATGRAAAGRPGAALRHSRESRPPRSQSGEQGRRARAPGAGRERALLRAHRRGRSTARRGALVYTAGARLTAHGASCSAPPPSRAAARAAARSLPAARSPAPRARRPSVGRRPPLRTSKPALAAALGCRPSRERSATSRRRRRAPRRTAVKCHAHKPGAGRRAVQAGQVWEGPRGAAPRCARGPARRAARAR